jgi:hypothetical protein
VKGWGVPFFQTGRKKKQGIRVIYGILGVQKATKSLKRAFWVRSEVFKAVITYLRRFLAIFVGFFQFFFNFLLIRRFYQMGRAGTTFLT